MPYTIKDYSAEPNKAAKRTAFLQNFKPREHQYPHGKIMMDCPLTTELGIRQLIDSSHDLLTPYGNKKVRFLALGCTPLRILQTASLFPHSQGKTFDYVAFSGRYVYPDATQPGGLALKGAPTPAQLTAYRSYLNSINLHPRALISNHNAAQPLVIVEAILTGGGLFTFLFILDQWARQLGGPQLANQLRSCINLHLLRDDTVTDPRCMIDINQATFMRFPKIEQPVPNNLLGYLLESKEAFNDSLGLSYPVSAWLSPPPPAMGENVSPNSQLLSFHIIDYVVTHPELVHTNAGASNSTNRRITDLRQRGIDYPNQSLSEEEGDDHKDEQEDDDRQDLTCCQKVARMFGATK